MRRIVITFLCVVALVGFSATQGCAPEKADEERASTTHAGPAAGGPPESGENVARQGTRPDFVIERKGIIFRGDVPLTLLGEALEVGDTAPGFELVGTKGAVAGSSSPDPVSSGDFTGRVVVVSVVPSLDTPVCEVQTGKIAGLQPELPAGTVLLTVSRDLPFAQRRFKETNELEIHFASDFADASFGRAWGLLTKETGLLARSVWVLDRSGRVAYREIVRDQTTEPDYTKVVDAVNHLNR